MGAANATATPAADDALRTSRRFPAIKTMQVAKLPSLKLYLSNIRQAMLPTQHAICTKGPGVRRAIV